MKVSAQLSPDLETGGGNIARPVPKPRIGGAPELLQVIKDATKPPLSLKDFRSFMRSQHAEENVDFLVTEDKFESNLQATLADVKGIVHEYIQDGAEKEINISYTMRSELLDNASRLDESQTVDRMVFFPARAEISTILNNGPYIKFIKEQTKTNLNAKQVDNRYRISAMVFILAFCPMFAALLACQILGVPYMDNRWWRVLLLLPIFFSASFYLSARRRL